MEQYQVLLNLVYFYKNDKTQGEGFVSIREIGDDFYEYDDQTYNDKRKKGTNQKFKIGDKVKAKISEVDVEERRISLTMKV